MTLNFPTSPSVNDTYTYNGTTFVWDGEKWDASTPFLVNSSNIVDGAITASKLAADSVTAEKVDSSAVTNNLVINGSMAVAQRGTSATVSNGSNEGYSTVDRWFLNFNDSIGGATTFSQSTDAPAGFANSAKIQCSTTASGFSSNQYLALAQKFEGQNLQSLAYGTADAKSVTVSWYMKTDVYTDPISVTLFTIFGTPEYYTVSVTPTTSWAKYSVTVPGSSTATINNDNLRALDLQFVLAGNTSSAIAAASDSTAYSTTRADFRTDVGNFLSSTSNAIYITGVQLTASAEPLPFQHEDYATTLQKCQRYYKQFGPVNNFPLARSSSSGSSGRAYSWWTFSPTMRAAPSVSIVGTFTTGVPQISQTSETGTRFGSTQTNLAAGASENLVSSPDGGFTFDAEL